MGKEKKELKKEEGEKGCQVGVKEEKGGVRNLK